MGVRYVETKAGQCAAVINPASPRSAEPKATSMNNPSLAQAPANVTADTMKMKIAREADKKRNREVSHLLKTASLHRPVITRSVPHVRGR